MAATVQRGISLLTALLNAAPTQAQIDRAKAAFNVGLPPDATNEELVEVMLREVHEFLIKRIMQRERQAQIEAVDATTETSVRAAFAPVPEV